jgi:hypothetical protein
MDNMSSYHEQLRARIAEKRRKLEKIKSANLLPVDGSVNAIALVMQELRRQIAVDEGLLANYTNA